LKVPLSLFEIYVHANIYGEFIFGNHSLSPQAIVFSEHSTVLQYSFDFYCSVGNTQQWERQKMELCFILHFY